MSFTAARIKAYDRRRTAMHEAGHALVAKHLGYRAEAWIYQNDVDDLMASKSWLGHTSFYGAPNTPGHPHLRMIAVAGMVAEILWNNRGDENCIDPGFWADVLFDRDCMSVADWRLADCDPDEPDDHLLDVIVRVADLLAGELWPSLIRGSRTLMSAPESVHSFQPSKAAARAA